LVDLLKRTRSADAFQSVISAHSRHGFVDFVIATGQKLAKNFSAEKPRLQLSFVRSCVGADRYVLILLKKSHRDFCGANSGVR